MSYRDALRLGEFSTFADGASAAELRPLAKETLLAALCRVNGQQGGTIHQFFPHANSNDVMAMDEAFKSYSKAGIEFPSRKAFEKLAENYHVTIQWGK